MGKGLGAFITKHYKMIILVSILATILSVLGMLKLEIKTQMLDLLPENEKVVLAYKDARDNFESMDSIVVGVKGKRDDIEKFIEEKADDIEKFKGVKSVKYKLNEEFFKKNALILTKAKDIEDAKTAFGASSLEEFLKGLNDNFEKAYIDDGDSKKIDKDKFKLLKSFNYFNKFLLDIKNGTEKAKAEEFFIGDKYFISHEDNLGIFMVKSKVDIDDINGVVELVNSLESYLKEEGKRYNVDVDLTGTLVIMRDEMVVTERDMTLTSSISLLLIFAIFLIAFRLLRYSVLALIPLFVGVVWSLGITYLMIGHLNIMTSMMGAILIGLGIDYSIHIISVFIDEKKEGLSNKEALIVCFDKSIKGVITGAVTTAAGFLLFAVSDFPGFREFGIVLSTGIISVLTASVFLLPSLIIVFAKMPKLYKRRTEGFFIGIENFVVNKNKIFIIMTILLTVLFMWNIKNVAYEKDMLKIEAKGLKSIKLNEEIIDKFDFSSDISIIKSDNLSEDQDIYQRADDMLTVGSIDSLAMYIPDTMKQEKRIEKIVKIKSELSKDLKDNVDREEFLYELQRFQDNLIEISDLSYAGGDEKLTNKIDGIINSGIIDEISSNFEKYRENILKKQHSFIKDLRYLIENLSENIITEEDVPESIKEDYIGKDGTYLSRIYPKESIWKEDFQKIHMKEIKTLSDDITGSGVVFLKVIEESGKEGKKILLFTVIVIYIILLSDLRNIKYATMALLPMILSVIFTLGLMAFFNIKFNVVNIIGVPLIIGIGIDDGVHIIHRYIREKSINSALQSTGKAITLTTITTIGAFGTMLLAKYRGFIGLALVLVIGVGLAYIMTIFFLVSLIALLEKKQKNN